MVADCTRVELCGRLADPCGPLLDLPIPADGMRVADLISILGERFPPLQHLLADQRVRACINEAVVANDMLVRPGDLVALFPPVSGG